VFGHSAADSYRTVLYRTVRCVLGKLKCREIVIKFLDGIWERAVQLWVHIVCVCVCVYIYIYSGYCCVCHGENIKISFILFVTASVV
jgi:hypothetical protein